MYALGDSLYLIDRKWVFMQPVEDVLWRYNGTSNVLQRIGKFDVIDTLAAMGECLGSMGKRRHYERHAHGYRNMAPE